MRIALTGATGFIGSHVLAALQEHGHEVTALVRDEPSAEAVRAREGAKAHVATVEEHARILDALERRDSGAARHEMAEHLLRGTSIEERAQPLLEWWRAK